MKAEINIDTQEIENKITQKVINALKPLLTNGKADDIIYTVKTLSEYLHVSSQYIYERIKLNEIPYIALGKGERPDYRFRKPDIDQWFDSLKTPAINPLTKNLKIVK